MVQFYVFLEVSASHIVNIAKMEVTSNVNCDLLVNADRTETDSFTFVLKLLKIDIQVFCGNLIG